MINDLSRFNRLQYNNNNFEIIGSYLRAWHACRITVGLYTGEIDG